MIPLPAGAKFFTMPGYEPLGWNADLGQVTYLSEPGENLTVVSAFLPPGYTRLLLPGAYYRAGKSALPLWAYTALAWKDGRFWAPAVKIDDDSRWNPAAYDDRGIGERIAAKRRRLKGNRLVEQLAICAQDYHCFAAKNFFSERWECPLPVSPHCNADCAGCISFQPQHKAPASMERLKFVPTPGEIAAIAADHMRRAPDPLLSFGQGCEGDPLMQTDTVETAIRMIRSEFPDASINMNTNASMPACVKRCADAGLDSIRISMNSALPDRYTRYFRQKDYTFDDVLESIGTAVDSGMFVNLNLLIFPGISDQEDEIEALIRIVRGKGVHRIQMKNLNIDPHYYLEAVGYPESPGAGIRKMMRILTRECPGIQFGYFNVSKSAFFRDRQYV